MKHIIKAGLTGGVHMIGSYFKWIIRYSSHPEKYPLRKRYSKIKKLTAHVNKTLSVKIYSKGEENIDESRACCYFSNHYSSYDPVLFILTMNQPVAFVAKKEIYKYFILGRCFRTLEGEFLDRNDLRQSLKVMQNVQKDLTNGTKNWVIYPEGTRNKDNLSPIPDFHYGSFKAAMKAKVPIVPVATYGTFRVLKTKPEHKVYPVQISYLKPIMPEEYEKMTTEEVAKLVRDRIQKEIMYKLRPLDNELMSSLKDKKYRFNYNY